MANIQVQLSAKVTIVFITGVVSAEKTKNLLFNGAKPVIGKLWTSEEGSVEQQPSGHVETSACQTLLRGQMLIGQDGKLMKANTAQSEPESNMMYLVNIKGKNSVILVPGLLTWWDDKWTLYFQNCLAEKSSMKKSSLFEQKSLNDFHLA